MIFVTQVEDLEQQLVQMTRLLDEESQKYKDCENERNEAVEKIKLLRDIIRDLEGKCESKSNEVKALVETVEKLEGIIDEQEKSADDIKHSQSFKDISDLNDLYQKHIEHLEAELQQLRVNSELAGTEGPSMQLKKEVGTVF